MIQLGQDLADAGRSLAPELEGVYTGLIEKIGLPQPGAPPRPPHALSLPVLELPYWVGLKLERDQGRDQGASRRLAMLAAAHGYMLVRLQDDRLDEGLGEESSSLMLGNVLMIDHVASLYAAAGPPAPEWAAQIRRAWCDFGDGMLVERQHDPVGSWTLPAWERSMGRFAPLILPAVAMLHHAGVPGHAPTLAELLHPLVRAHQLVEDAFDLFDDLAAGRRTWFATRLGPDPDAVWLGGGLAEAIDEAERLLAPAAQAWSKAGYPDGAAHIARRIYTTRARLAGVEDTLARLWRQPKPRR